MFLGVYRFNEHLLNMSEATCSDDFVYLIAIVN